MLSQQRDIFGKVEAAEPDLAEVVLFLENELALVEEGRIDRFCHFLFQNIDYKVEERMGF